MSEARRVYSTEDGDLRGRQGDRRARRATPGQAVPAVPADGVVRVGRTKSGRKGRVVTLVTGLPGDEAALKTSLADLKRLCGSGGTLRDGAVEVQGDHRERIAAHLTSAGHRVKLTGG
jgi:translation initiation factor 1